MSATGFMDWIWGKQEFVQQAVEQLPDGIYASDLDSGRWAYLNQAMGTITGFSLEELYAMGVEGFRARVHPDDQERNLAGIRRLLEQGGPETLEYRWLHKDGTYRWLNSTRTVLPAGEAHARILVGTLRDITEQKQAEEERSQTEQALRESEARYRSLYDATTAGIVLQDAEGQIVEANEAAQEIIGLTRSNAWLDIHGSPLAGGTRRRVPLPGKRASHCRGPSKRANRARCDHWHDPTQR